MTLIPPPVTLVLIVHKRLLASGEATSWFRPRDGLAAVPCSVANQWELSSNDHLPTVVVADEPAFAEAEGLLKRKSRASRPRFLILGPEPLSDLRIGQLLLSGAMGYASEKSSPALLRKVVRCVARGEYWASRTVLSHVIAELLNVRPQTRLTFRELEVIQRLSGGLSNRQIATEMGISSETVRWHLRRIYSKLGVRERERAIQGARAWLAETVGASKSEPDGDGDVPLTTTGSD